VLGRQSAITAIVRGRRLPPADPRHRDFRRFHRSPAILARNGTDVTSAHSDEVFISGHRCLQFAASGSNPVGPLAAYLRDRIGPRRAPAQPRALSQMPAWRTTTVTSSYCAICAVRGRSDPIDVARRDRPIRLTAEACESTVLSFSKVERDLFFFFDEYDGADPLAGMSMNGRSELGDPRRCGGRFRAASCAKTDLGIRLARCVSLK